MKLSGLQLKAIELLLEGVAKKEIEEKLGIVSSTLWNWEHRDAEFAQTLKEARAAQLKSAIGRLRDVTDIALDTVIDIMTNNLNPVSTRLSAATDLLDRAGVTEEEIKIAVTDNTPKDLSKHLSVEELKTLKALNKKVKASDAN